MGPTRVFPPGKKPADVRLSQVRHLDLKDFFFKPPATKAAWEKRRQQVREQILVATGLWPMPPKTPLKPVIHGKIDRDGYTIEKVYFASLPGHYVTGNLYRPKGKTGKLPAILSPHGHFTNGRLYQNSEAGAKKEVTDKAEERLEGATYPLQALCAQLARMGCVVFHYDMVGYADSKAIPHQSFNSVEANLRLQNLMGLQTWNSIRSLDFLLSLPEVDPKRVGVTGHSGGGTQTFILCAVDERPAVAFPAVMVGTQMQGGCVCENAPLLRVGTGNVEFAALTAPRPLGMTGADDWTIDIEKKGLPELKALYNLYGKPDNVMARCFPRFGHNYNQVSRQVMYNWFNDHFGLGRALPIREKAFKPVLPKDLAVFDQEHPQPKDAVNAERLRDYWTETSDHMIEALRPSDPAKLVEFRKIVGAALRAMVASRLPDSSEIDKRTIGNDQTYDGAVWRKLLLGRKGAGEAVPALAVRGKEFNGEVVVWVSPQGKASLLEKGKLSQAARKVLDNKGAILALDPFGVGELSMDKKHEVNGKCASYTFGYNRSLLAQRVHDILTAVAAAQDLGKTKKVHLVGFEEAGPWVLIARGLCGSAVQRTAADVNRFRFDKVRNMGDDMMLPGALKYGGLSAFAALASPAELFVHNHGGTGIGRFLNPAYQSSEGTSKLKKSSDKVAAEEVVAWLLH
jgi:dienelactone hydrolase